MSLRLGCVVLLAAAGLSLAQTPSCPSSPGCPSFSYPNIELEIGVMLSPVSPIDPMNVDEWELQNPLPAGLVLNETTGVLSGTPMQTGVFSAAVLGRSVTFQGIEHGGVLVYLVQFSIGPSGNPAGVLFTDTDFKAGVFGGVVTILSPGAAAEADIDSYELLWGSGPTTPLALDATIVADLLPTGADIVYTLPAGTQPPAGAAFILAVSRSNNALGLAPAAVPLTDTESPVGNPAALSLADTAPGVGVFAGVVDITVPASAPDVTSYNLWFGTADGVALGAAIVIGLAPPVAPATNLAYVIDPAVTAPAGATHLLAFSANANGEGSFPATLDLSTTDYQPPIPTITTTAGASTPLTSIPITITFNQDVSGVAASHVAATSTNATVAVTSLVAASASTYTAVVEVSAPLVASTITVTFPDAAPGVTPANVATQAPLVVAYTPPEATMRGPGDSASGATVLASPIDFQVSFSQDVAGLDVSAFVVASTAAGSGVTTQLSASSPSSYTLRVSLQDAAVASNITVSLPAGVTTPPNAAFDGFVVLLRPPSAAVTTRETDNGFGVDLVFSAPVTGLTAADFLVAATGGASVTRSLTGAGTTYAFVVEVLSPLGATDLTVSLPASVGSVSPPNAAAGPFVLSFQPPTVAISGPNPLTPVTNPIVTVLATFSRDVAGVSNSTFDVSPSNAIVTVTPGVPSATVYNIRVELPLPVSDADVAISVPEAAAGVTPLTVASPVFTVAYRPPVAVLTSPHVDVSGGSTNRTDITMVATFQTAVTGLTAAHFTVNVPDGVNASVALVGASAGFTQYTLLVTLDTDLSLALFTVRMPASTGALVATPPVAASELFVVEYNAAPGPVLKPSDDDSIFIWESGAGTWAWIITVLIILLIILLLLLLCYCCCWKRGSWCACCCGCCRGKEKAVVGEEEEPPLKVLRLKPRPGVRSPMGGGDAHGGQALAVVPQSGQEIMVSTGPSTVVVDGASAGGETKAAPRSGHASGYDLGHAHAVHAHSHSYGSGVAARMGPALAHGRSPTASRGRSPVPSRALTATAHGDGFQSPGGHQSKPRRGMPSNQVVPVDTFVGTTPYAATSPATTAPSPFDASRSSGGMPAFGRQPRPNTLPPLMAPPAARPHHYGPEFLGAGEEKSPETPPRVPRSAAASMRSASEFSPQPGPGGSGGSGGRPGDRLVTPPNTKHGLMRRRPGTGPVFNLHDHVGGGAGEHRPATDTKLGDGTAIVVGDFGVVGELPARAAAWGTPQKGDDSRPASVPQSRGPSVVIEQTPNGGLAVTQQSTIEPGRSRSPTPSPRMRRSGSRSPGRHRPTSSPQRSPGSPTRGRSPRRRSATEAPEAAARRLSPTITNLLSESYLDARGAVRHPEGDDPVAAMFANPVPPSVDGDWGHTRPVKASPPSSRRPAPRRVVDASAVAKLRAELDGALVAADNDADAAADARRRADAKRRAADVAASEATQQMRSADVEVRRREREAEDAADAAAHARTLAASSGGRQAAVAAAHQAARHADSVDRSTELARAQMRRLRADRAAAVAAARQEATAAKMEAMELDLRRLAALERVARLRADLTETEAVVGQQRAAAGAAAADYRVQEIRDRLRVETDAQLAAAMASAMGEAEGMARQLHQLVRRSDVELVRVTTAARLDAELAKIQAERDLVRARVDADDWTQEWDASVTPAVSSRATSRLDTRLRRERVRWQTGQGGDGKGSRGAETEEYASVTKALGGGSSVTTSRHTTSVTTTRETDLRREMRMEVEAATRQVTHAQRALEDARRQAADTPPKKLT